jgi:hypothetical protein
MPRGVPGPVAKVKQPKKKANKGSFSKERPGPGRKPGVPNKFTGELKAELLSAFNGAHPNGLAAWVLEQARANPTAAMSLLGRLIPMNMDVAADIKHDVTVSFK